MHAQLEALLLSSLAATADVVLTAADHSHCLRVTLCNNGPIALPELLLQLSSADPAVVAAGILPPPPPDGILPPPPDERAHPGGSSGCLAPFPHCIFVTSCAALPAL
jgi:hypothetical protein